MGGVWFDSGTQTLMGSLNALKTYNILGFHVPWVNIDFFTIGVPKLLSFDFAFFGGSFAAFKYAMYIFSIGIIWGIVAVVIGVIANIGGRLGR
jgi:hypothetical protein